LFPRGYLSSYKDRKSEKVNHTKVIVSHGKMSGNKKFKSASKWNIEVMHDEVLTYFTVGSESW
jgi:hypothetical protein